MQLLLRLASVYKVDLDDLQGESAGHARQLREVFADPLLSGELPGDHELVEIADAAPNVASGIVKLYRAYREQAARLTDLADLLAREGVNLKTVAGVSEAGKAIICLVGDDVNALRTSLTEGRIPFEEHELLTELVENEPGALAGLTAKLSGAGVNVNSLYVLTRESDMEEIGFTVDNVPKAKKALGQ